MGKNYCIKGMVVCLVIILTSFFLYQGCVSDMPAKKSNMELGEQVKPPQGYIDWKKRR